METIYPVIAMAHSSFRFPTHFTRVYAIFSAAPDTSKMRPIITPNPITIPIDPKVDPNPAVIALMTSGADMPPTSPVMEAAMIRAKNA